MVQSSSVPVPSIQAMATSFHNVSCDKRDDTILKMNDSLNQEDPTSVEELNEDSNAKVDSRYDDIYSTGGSIVGRKATDISVGEENKPNIRTPTNEGFYDRCTQNEHLSGEHNINNRYEDIYEEKSVLNSSLPQVPKRTSSSSITKVKDDWKPRNSNTYVNKSVSPNIAYQIAQQKGKDTNKLRAYINVKELSTANNLKSPFISSRLGCSPAMFPPDKDSPMSPPPTDNPPKINTLPYRCVSVASSSIKSRSVFYASVPSDRVESPSYSALNHSYETLNISDTAETSSVGAQSADSNQKENTPRLPHRPAPPIPTPKYKMTAV